MPGRRDPRKDAHAEPRRPPPRGVVPDGQPRPVRPGDARQGGRPVPHDGRPLDAAPRTARPGGVESGAHRAGGNLRPCWTPTPTTTASGVIVWMHTFSPAKMWIGDSPHCASRCCTCTPSSTSTPLGRAGHGFHEPQPGCPRGPGDRVHPDAVGVARKTVAGHVTNPAYRARIATWPRAATAATAIRTLKLARFGDNMRQVAVTEGDKVEAEIRFGVSVNTYGVNDLVASSTTVRRGHRRTGRAVRGAVRHGDELRPVESATIPCDTAPPSRPACRAFSSTVGSAHSPRTSKTSAGCGSCPAWRCSG